MKKVAIFIILTALIMIPSLVFGQETYKIPEDIIYSRPAPDWVIEKAKTHIISFVGENYFKDHFSLSDSYKISVVPSIQDIYMEGGFRAIYQYEVEGVAFASELELVSVTFGNGGNVSEYVGPKKPYVFSITAEEAIEKAKKVGLTDTKRAYVSYTYSILDLRSIIVPYDPSAPVSPKDFESIDDYTWWVEGSYGQWVDSAVAHVGVDAGDVLGIASTVGGKAGPYAEIRPFLEPAPAPGPEEPAPATPTPAPGLGNLILVLVVVIIVVVVIAIGAILYFRKRQ